MYKGQLIQSGSVTRQAFPRPPGVGQMRPRWCPSAHESSLGGGVNVVYLIATYRDHSDYFSEGKRRSLIFTWLCPPGPGLSSSRSAFGSGLRGLGNSAALVGVCCHRSAPAGHAHVHLFILIQIFLNPKKVWRCLSLGIYSKVLIPYFAAFIPSLGGKVSAHEFYVFDMSPHRIQITVNFTVKWFPGEADSNQ